jgi:hypothetical protein
MSDIDVAGDGLTGGEGLRANRVSEQQGELLLWLLECYRTSAIIKLGAARFGYRVRLERLPRGVSRSESASQSRALRRLEDRGLVERSNWVQNRRGSRTTHVRLTAAGWDLAERLAENTRPELTADDVEGRTDG